MPPTRPSKAGELFRSLLEIYWPLLLFGGIRLVFILVRKGPAHLWHIFMRFFTEPQGHMVLFCVVLLAAVLTPVLVILMMTSKAPGDEPPQPEEEEERFPELNYRLKPQRKSGRAPQPVQKVIIPRTVPASAAAAKPASCLRVLCGGREELSAPLSPGTYTARVNGCIITVTVERESGTIAEDITRELTLPQ